MSKIFKNAPPLPEEDRRLIELYANTGRPLDDLPYTKEFDELYENLRQSDESRSKQEVFHRLLTLRKAGRLSRIGRTATNPVEIKPGEEEVVFDLIPMYAGTVGHRDSLVYTDEFDRLTEDFNRRTGRELDRHDMWRIVSRLAK